MKNSARKPQIDRLLSGEICNKDGTYPKFEKYTFEQVREVQKLPTTSSVIISVI